MEWQDLFLSFEGRIARAKFWIGAGVSALSVSTGFFLLGLVPYFGTLIALVAFLAAASICISIGVKRLHDRSRSGAWLILFYLAPPSLGWMSGTSASFIPGSLFAVLALAITVWTVVELGLLRGTEGRNSYGPDPLGFRDWRTA
jgi:uncharacterized membrane protein YhaH (DUF805 family)